MRTPLQWLRGLLAAGSSRAAAQDIFPHHRTWGIGQDWAPTNYGNYYAAAAAVYAAIRIRADALSRTRLQAVTVEPDGSRLPVGPRHPLQALLDAPNDHFTGDELLRATETYLCLWGKAYWAIEQADGRTQLWPIRPDKLVTLPGAGSTYIKGYLYHGAAGDVAYLPEEIVPFSYFNPLQDRTGLSPIAPLRLTIDMAMDALRYNRQTFKNGGIPDYILFAENEMTDPQIEAFYRRWEARFQGADKSHRPAIASGLKDMKSLAFSQREMEFIEGLKWSIEEVARVYGVPQPYLGSLRDATLANVQVLERIFWSNTLTPETVLLQGKITNVLLPALGFANMAVQFDLSNIKALTEEEEPRLKREVDYLDRGVLTINEVRASRGLTDIEGGNDRRWRRQPTSQDAAQAAFRGNGAHSAERPSGDRSP